MTARRPSAPRARTGTRGAATTTEHAARAAGKFTGTGKSGSKPAGKPGGKPAGKSGSNPAGKSGGKPAGKSGGKPAGRGAAKPAGKPTAKLAAVRRAASARNASAVVESSSEPRQITVRTIVLVVVILTAFIVLAPTLRAYVSQQEVRRDLNAQIETAQEGTEQLQRTVGRWGDDAFVRAQARERLGFVMPGETPYRVVDPETVTGVPVDDGGAEVTGPGTVPQTGPWYLTVWDSVQLAGEVSH